MPDFTVHIVDDDQEPVEGVKVFLMVHHNFMPDTWLEEKTDSDGEAEFEVPRFTQVDVYVDGEKEEEGIDIGEDDDDITISFSPYDDDEDD